MGKDSSGRSGISAYTEALGEIKRAIAQRSNDTPESIVFGVMQVLAKARPDSYWVGVYLLKGQELHVGPYVGPTTEHTRIPIGKGVCGTAVAENANQIVGDVSAIGNYLACNIYTKSEIVVLIRDSATQTIVGQIDIDSTINDAFTAEDERALDLIGKEIAVIVAKL